MLEGFATKQGCIEVSEARDEALRQPQAMVTDRLRAYDAAMKDIGVERR